MSTKKLVFGGLFAALIFIGTYAFHVPYGSGYIHAGDTFIYLAGAMLGPVAALAAGIGSMLADLVAGYGSYALPTFLIKAADGLVVALVFGKLVKHKENWASTSGKMAISGLIGGVVMIAGYFGFEYFVYPEYAFVNLPGNLIQVTVAIIMASVIIPFVHNLKSQL